MHTTKWMKKKKEDLPTISLLWHLITDHIYAVYFFYRKRKHLRALQPHTAKFLQYSQHTSWYLCCVLGAVEVVVQEKTVRDSYTFYIPLQKDINILFSIQTRNQVSFSRRNVQSVARLSTKEEMDACPWGMAATRQTQGLCSEAFELCVS